MPETTPDKLSFRQVIEKDIDFIYATWLNSYYHHSRFTERMRKSIFFEYHRQVIRRILDSPKTTVLVACSSEDPETIFGYIVTQDYIKPIIHYAYVKGAFQGLGIAGELVRESGLDISNCYFTHYTFNCAWVLDKHPELVYNPYLI